MTESEDSAMLLRTPRRYVIELDGLPPSLNATLRASLRQRLRDKKQWREAVAWQTRALHRGAPLARARVTITLYRTGGPARDHDGAVSSIKHCLDGLTVRGGGTLLVDDDEAHIALVVRQQVGVRRCVVIEVEETL